MSGEFLYDYKRTRHENGGPDDGFNCTVCAARRRGAEFYPESLILKTPSDDIFAGRKELRPVFPTEFCHIQHVEQFFFYHP